VDSIAIRQRLLDEAAGAGAWQDLWPGVMAARAALLQAFRAVPAGRLAVRPGKGEGEAAWSAAEVALHIFAYTRNVTAIIEATTRGESLAKDPPGTLARAEAPDRDALYRLLVDESTRLATLHERLPGEPNLDATVRHAFFGPLNAREWYAFLRLHDSDHAAQLNRLAAAGG
jgi:hypothetical protein